MRISVAAGPMIHVVAKPRIGPVPVVNRIFLLFHIQLFCYPKYGIKDPQTKEANHSQLLISFFIKTLLLFFYGTHSDTLRSIIYSTSDTSRAYISCFFPIDSAILTKIFCYTQIVIRNKSTPVQCQEHSVCGACRRERDGSGQGYIEEYGKRMNGIKPRVA